MQCTNILDKDTTIESLKDDKAENEENRYLVTVGFVWRCGKRKFDAKMPRMGIVSTSNLQIKVEGNPTIIAPLVK